jgi:hypothetical protein
MKLHAPWNGIGQVSAESPANFSALIIFIPITILEAMFSY